MLSFYLLINVIFITLSFVVVPDNFVLNTLRGKRKKKSKDWQSLRTASMEEYNDSKNMQEEQKEIDYCN